jgi:hypothetical protein
MSRQIAIIDRANDARRGDRPAIGPRGSALRQSIELGGGGGGGGQEARDDRQPACSLLLSARETDGAAPYEMACETEDRFFGTAFQP